MAEKHQVTGVNQQKNMSLHLQQKKSIPKNPRYVL